MLDKLRSLLVNVKGPAKTIVFAGPSSLVASRYFFDKAAAFLCNSQRRFTASAMRFRPSGESFLFFLRGGLIAGAAMETVAAAARFGLPTFFGVTVAEPVSSARTCFNKAISRSTDARISDTPIRTSIDEDDRSELRSTWPQPFISDSPEDTIFAYQLFGKFESVLKRSSCSGNTPIETHKAGR